MEVILKQDVPKIGKSGAVVKVKDGYARNFLIPNGLAVSLTPENLKKLEEEKQRKILQSEKIKKEVEAIKAKLDSFSLTLPALTQEDDKLYGSITAQDIAAALKEEGFDVEKGSIIIDEPIKSLGIYEVSIKLHLDILAKVKVWIVKKLVRASRQRRDMPELIPAALRSKAAGINSQTAAPTTYVARLHKSSAH